jgi:hypothetical protein
VIHFFIIARNTTMLFAKSATHKRLPLPKREGLFKPGVLQQVASSVALLANSIVVFRAMMKK